MYIHYTYSDIKYTKHICKHITYSDIKYTKHICKHITYSDIKYIKIIESRFIRVNKKESNDLPQTLNFSNP